MKVTREKKMCIYRERSVATPFIKKNWLNIPQTKQTCGNFQFTAFD